MARKNKDAANPADREGTLYTKQSGYDPETGLATATSYMGYIRPLEEEIEQGGKLDTPPTRTAAFNRQLRKGGTRQRPRLNKHSVEREAGLSGIRPGGDRIEIDWNHKLLFEFSKEVFNPAYWQEDEFSGNSIPVLYIYTCDMGRFRMVVEPREYHAWKNKRRSYSRAVWMASFIDTKNGDKQLIVAEGETAKLALAKLFGTPRWFVVGATNINPETVSTYRVLSLYEMYGPQNILWVGIGRGRTPSKKPKYKNYLPRPCKGKMVWQVEEVGLPLCYKLNNNKRTASGKDRRFEPPARHITK